MQSIFEEKSIVDSDLSGIIYALM